MSESITVSLKVVDEFSASLKGFEDAFNSASVTAVATLKNVSEEIKLLKDSVNQLNDTLSTDLNAVSLQDVTLEIGTVIAAVVALNAKLKTIPPLLRAIGVYPITILISAKVGWDIGTWAFENIIQPMTSAIDDRHQEVVDKLTAVSTDALSQLDTVYRQAGDNIKNFASIGAASFETLRSRATDELEQLHAALERLNQIPEHLQSDIIRNQAVEIQNMIDNGERVLEYLDKNRTAIHDLSGENNSLTGTYERLSQSVMIWSGAFAAGRSTIAATQSMGVAA